MNVSKSQPVRFFLVAFLTLLAFAAARRVVSMVYSIAVTDIVYAESALPTILYYASQLLSLLACGLGAASIVCAYLYASAGTGIVTAASVVGISLLDKTAAFLIDLVQSNITGREVVALISLALNFLFDAALFATIALISYLLSRKYTERFPFVSLFSLSNPPQRAVLFASVTVLAFHFGAELVYTLEFLIDVGFELYEGELFSILSSYAGILLSNGVLTFLAVTCAALLLRHTFPDIEQ